MKPNTKVVLIFLGAFFLGCSSRPEEEITLQNSIKVKAELLFSEIEQASFDCKRTNGVWSLTETLDSIRQTKSNRFTVAGANEITLLVNPMGQFWANSANADGEIAIICKHPFLIGKATNFVALNFQGKPLLTNRLPSWGTDPVLKGFR